MPSDLPTQQARKWCFSCGTEVGADDWEYVGRTRIFVCGASECQHELSRAHHDVLVEARWQAEEDGYERYF